MLCEGVAASLPQACKYALRLLGPLVGSEMMSNMFQRHLLEDGTLHYGEFMNDLSKVMVGCIYIGVVLTDWPSKISC